MRTPKEKRIQNMKYSEETFFMFAVWFFGKLEPKETPRDIIQQFPINHKRAWYILEKWTSKGWYSYGVNLELGWITPEGEKELERRIHE